MSYIRLVGAIDGRRGEAGARARAAHHQETAPRGGLAWRAFKPIALDVDGVLTDGSFWWGPNGEEWKRFSFADIMGVSLARKAGLRVALISGEDSPLVDRFAAKMGISDVYKNCKDKAERFAPLRQRRAESNSAKFASWATT